MGECLYISFWKDQLPFIEETIRSGYSNSKKIDLSELQSYSREGKRTTLRFRVIIQNGIASTKTNSAIARDLCSVLNSDNLSETVGSVGDREVVINLLNGDNLNITI